MTDVVSGPVARPSLHAITRAAVEATGSDAGWLLSKTGDDLTVVATAGGATPVAGTLHHPRRGTAAMVLASGQAAALLPRPSDEANHGAAGLDCVPGALLVVPCAAQDVVGVLELGRVDPENYGFDELELVVLLGEIAGVMLEEEVPVAASGPAPEEVYRQLTAAAAYEPDRYLEVVRTIGWMLR